MKKDVLISICGRQIFDGCEEDTVDFLTDGRFYRRNDKYYITYQESELTGLQGMTTLKVEPNRITMTRTKPCETQLIFEKGRRHVSLYETTQGALTIAVNTEQIECHLGDNGGTLNVRYAIEIDNAVAGLNFLSVSVREADAHAIKN